MKKILSVTLTLLALMFLSHKAYADVNSGAKTYSVTIPSATTVVLSNAVADFGTISTSEFGVGNPSSHTISVGDGSGTSASFVQSNDPAAGAKQYTISFGGNYAASSLTTASGKAKINVTSASPAASVGIFLSNSAQATLPKLGSVAFVVAGDTLNIPTSSTVVYSATKAPLDLKLDLDEGTVGYDDAPTTLNFTMTLTAVGLN